jgi:hypothetical protein
MRVLIFSTIFVRNISHKKNWVRYTKYIYIYIYIYWSPSTVQYSTVQRSTVQYSTVQYSTVQYSTVQHSAAQHSAAQHSTVQYSTVQYSTVHSYTQTIQRTTQKLGRVQTVLRLCRFYPGICITTEDKARKNLSQSSHTIRTLWEYNTHTIAITLEKYSSKLCNDGLLTETCRSNLI